MRTDASTANRTPAAEKLYSEPEPQVCEAPPPPPSPPPPALERAKESEGSKALMRRGKVEICARPVDTDKPGSLTQKLSNFAAKLGLDHRFIKTTTKEAGMGPAAGGIPQKADYPYGQGTTLNDHAGQGERADAACKPVPDVDEECVNEKLRYGSATGVWLPPFHDCHDVVKKITDECSVPPEADRQYLDSKGIP